MEILPEDVNGIMLFLGTWASSSIIMGAIKEIDHLPLAAWAFPMFKEKGKQKSTGSLVALSVLKGTLDAINVKCQPELSQIYGCVACLPLSLIAGESIVAACEGDLPVTVTMLMLHYLSGKVVTYGDMLDIHDDQILLSPCGFAPLSLAAGEGVDTELREGRFPALEIKLDGEDIKEFTEALKANHYALVYGDLTHELLELCRMLDIKTMIY